MLQYNIEISVLAWAAAEHPYSEDILLQYHYFLSKKVAKIRINILAARLSLIRDTLISGL